MIKPNWTPGPWEWREDAKHSCDCYKCFSGLDGPTRKDVLTMEDTFPGYPECGEELRIFCSPQNANLICAVPDMAEALMILTEAAGDRCESGKNCGGICMWCVARAALRKAGVIL